MTIKQPAIEKDCNVVIVGCGPSGITAASLLGKLGQNVVLIERWPEPYGLPRLTHIDGETARLVQSAGEIEHALRDSIPLNKNHYLDSEGEMLIDINWVGEQCGYPMHNSIFQPDIEEAICRNIESLPNVQILRGWEVCELTETDGGVTVTASVWKSSSEQSTESAANCRVYNADYVIGADGANSFVRRAIGVERFHYGHYERWLNLDSEIVGDLGDRFDTTTIVCDPARAHMWMPIGKSRIRFEFRVLPGEGSAYWEDQKNSLRWLKDQHGLDRKDVNPIRNVVYEFDPAMADQWKKGRILLAGDSAHTMMPYMGQGACSGIRDGANVAWKLDLVLRGLCDPKLLDTYEEERRPHVKVILETSTFLGTVVNEDDPEKVSARNAMLRSGKTSDIPPFPKVESGILHFEEDGSLLKATGAPTPQGIVRKGSFEGRLDDLTGNGFVIVAESDPTSQLFEAQREFLSRLAVKIIVPGENDEGPYSVLDVDGAQTSFLKEHGMAAYIRRPDFLLFGSVTNLGDLPSLLEDLKEKLFWRGQ